MPLERTNVTLLPFWFICSLRSVLVTSLNVETCKACKLVWRCFESLSMRLFELALVTNSWWSLFKTPLSKSVNKIMNLDKPSGLPVTNSLALFIKRSTISFICNDRNPGSICRTTECVMFDYKYRNAIPASRQITYWNLKTGESPNFHQVVYVQITSAVLISK